MTRIITIANQKGGIGKTSTALALGAGLKERGASVLYVDLDPQCNMSYALGAETSTKSAFGLLLKENGTRETIQTTPAGDVISASEALTTADLTLSDVTGREYRLKEALEPVIDDYDYILIDTPPSLGILTVNALTASGFLIIPAQAEVFSIQGIALLAKTIESIKKYCNSRFQVLGIVLTRHNARTNLAKSLDQLIARQAKLLGAAPFETTIREAVAVREAQALQKSIFEHAPTSNVASDYKAFITEVLERIESYEQEERL